MIPPPPISTLFPYTTLFRSRRAGTEPEPAPDRERVDLPVTRHRRIACRDLRHEVVTDDRCGRHRRSEEHTSELQSHSDLVCRLLLEKKKKLRHSPACRTLTT